MGGLSVLNIEEIGIHDRPVCLAMTDVRPPAFPLRLGPPSASHIATLVQLKGKWAPILVSADDYSIIDGYHRYLAARRLGHTHIRCHLFADSPDRAFLEALRLNARQGLALTLKEREHAARRVLDFHRDWSDRRIGELCGLSPTTVGRLRLSRPRPDVQNRQMDRRVGRDDRVRPLDSGALRRRVTEQLVARPHASLREIAVLAHCSPETVRSVRRSMETAPVADDAGPVPPAVPLGPRPVPGPDPSDQAFASTDAGTAFAEWFARTHVDADECAAHVMQIPLSRVYEIADLAHRRSDAWKAFARAVEARVKPAH